MAWSMKTENELIAEFMGFKPYKEAWGGSGSFARTYNINGDILYGNEMKYNSSWDWLMPVVEKIKKEHYFRFDIDSPGSVTKQQHTSVSIFQNWVGGGCTEVCEIEGEDMKSTIYKAVVEFIHWYNQQPK